MSNLLVQNIKHTNNTTAIEINSSAQMTVKSDGGATTISLQQGLIKAAGAVNMVTNGEIATNNVSSYTDRATGCVYASLSNGFSTTSYTTVCGSSPASIGSMATNNGNRSMVVSPDTTSRVSFNNFVCTSGAQDDDPYQAFIATGDLA